MEPEQARSKTTIWYRVLQPVVRWSVTRIASYELEGIEHFPARGSCLLVPNHQSVLDPLLLQGVLPRAVDSMTKSTQFERGFFRWLLPRVHTFPVRRYRVDAQSVRVLLRKLDEGRVVCVYPEGERTWDGTLQPLRKGALKVMLRAGVPVIPVGLRGMYDIWPRWAKRPRKGHAVIRIGEPIHFGEHRGREAIEAALPGAEALLRSVLLELTGETPREPDRPESAAEDAGRSGVEAI